MGDPISHQARVWIGGTLIAVLGVMTITIALAAVVLRNNCVVLGESDLKHRHCPLAMDTWLNLIVAEHQLALVLIWNTRKLTIAIPREYLDKTLYILRTVWPKYRQGKEAENVSLPWKL